MGTPTLLVVSGPAGSGKTTLAHTLAATIGCPALCRDRIKEGMVHALGGEFQATPGDPITQRTLLVFFASVRLLLGAGVTVVAEAAFQDHVWRPELEALYGVADLRIIRCRVDPVVGRRRIADRPPRTAHADASIQQDPRYYDDYVPVSLDVPTIDVDTSDGYKPTVDEILAFATVR